METITVAIAPLVAKLFLFFAQTFLAFKEMSRVKYPNLGRFWYILLCSENIFEVMRKVKI